MNASANFFRRSSERGQVMVIAALLLPILLGMTGLAVDYGSYASERRHLQNSADAIALAASQGLPDEDEATAIGEDWAAKNGLDLADVTLTVTGGDVEPVVHVVIQRPHSFAFMRILGVDERDVGARAAAAKVSFGGSAGIVPWSITEDTVNASPAGTLVTMKYDSNGVNNGNFGAIRIDGNGSSDYEEAAMYGSNTGVCAETTDGCTIEDCPGSDCAETAPDCDGPECQPKTGNMTGATREAVDFRIDHTSDTCDTFDEVFTLIDATTEKYQLEGDCNPWAGTGACPPAPSSVDCSRRVIIIPVIDSFGNGSSDDVTIQSFALLFLEGYDDGKCSGSSCEINGRFVNAELTTGALAGVYDPEASLQFTKLIE